MRILLQQKHSGLYFKESDVWTRAAAEEMDFLCSTRAIDYCMAHRLAGVQLVLKFDGQLYDIVLPMMVERRVDSARVN